MEKEEELFIPKTKNKGLKIILAIILIAALIGGAYFLYQKKFNDSKAIITNVLEDARSEIKKAFNTKSDDKKYKVDGHLNFDTNSTDESLKLLKDIELQLGGEIDSKNSLANFTLNTKYKSDKLIDINGYYENKVGYVLLNGLYDKYIKLDINEMEKSIEGEMPNIKIEMNDIEVIYDSFITAFSKEINNLDIKKSDDKITIDGKDVEVLDNAIILKDGEVNKLAKGIVTNLVNDQKFVATLNKITGEDIKKDLNEILEGIDEEEFKGTYKINFYTDKGMFEKKIVSVRQTIIQDEVTTTINVDKISDDEVLFTMDMMGINMSMRLKKNNSAVNATINVTTAGMYVKVNLSMNYEEIKEVTKPDVSNSIDYNSLTQEDIQKIQQRLMENKALLKLMEEVNKISNKESGAY